MFDKILIANRGEIALRVIRTCRRMGIGTTAVYSEADFRSPHVREADEACFIGPPPAPLSYLDKGKLIQAAVDHGCRAIHPGYGFLSENAEFARMTADAGLVFIGPPPEAVELLGDKIASKILAVKTGVPVVPGCEEPIAGIDQALAIADDIGFPLLLKPAAGGGGRGMRIVSTRDELPGALAACRDETRKGFGDERIFIERYVSRPRHIEIQIMADNHGNVVHLGERECSIQRRYQKVVEETPSPVVDPALRRRMGEVAVNLALAAGYSGAGTVEFVLDRDMNFYFLEMNTRLQVEHPITEMVTGLDLVELQVLAAAGEVLPLRQEDVAINGWAIEARICAEDPGRDFFPTTGMVTRYAAPRASDGVRVDSGIEAGTVITIHYDSLLAKTAAWGETREIARKKLVRALNAYHIEGLVTNVDFVNSVLDHPSFASGELSTDFIEDHFEDGRSKVPPNPKKMHFMILGAVLVHHTRHTLVRDSLRPMSPLVGAGTSRSNDQAYVVRVDEEVFHVRLNGDRITREWRIQVDDEAYRVITPEFEYYRRRLRLKIDGVSHMFRFRYSENHIQAFFCGIVRTCEIYSPLEWSLSRFMPLVVKDERENLLKCPMPGLLTAVLVKEGMEVRSGQELIRMESMKMESGIASPRDGVVKAVPVKPGQAVETDDVLVVFAD
ncbi:MAG: biotin carboxylase N-terminal domain-containing protein [Pseudomonadota bacterium]